MNMDIKYNFTENKNAKFFRSIDKLERIPWENSEQENITCHWGQKKLIRNKRGTQRKNWVTNL